MTAPIFAIIIAAAGLNERTMTYACKAVATLARISR